MNGSDGGKTAQVTVTRGIAEQTASQDPLRSASDAPTLYVALSSVAFVVYLLTLTHNFTDGEDALRYVRCITTGEGLWLFGNHLLFNLVGTGWYEIWSGLGYGGDALVPLQVLSAACAAISVGLIACLGRRIDLTLTMAVSAAVGAAMSSSYWAYGVLPDTYSLPIPFVLFGFICLLQAPSMRWVVAAAVSWSIATVLHQQNVLFFGPGALMLIRESANRRAGFGRAALLLSIGCALTLGSYVLVAVYGLGLRSMPDFVGYTLGYAKDGPWMPWSWLSIPEGLIGLLRSVFALDLVLGVDSVAQVVHRILPNTLIVEERYFDDFLHPAVLWGALVGIAASLSAALALMAMLVRQRLSGRASTEEGDRTGGSPRIALWLGLMIASQAIAVIAWEPINPEFWIATLPWLWLVLALVVHRSGDRRVRRLWFAFIALLGATNAMGYVIPQTDPRSDYWRQANALPLSLLEPGDQMVTLGGYVSDGYLGLQSRRAVYSGAEGIEEVHSQIVATPTEIRILISSWLVDPPPFLIGNAQLFLWDRDAAVRLLDCYRPNLMLLGQSPVQTVWELRRPIPICAGT